jgi:NACHT domain
VNICISNNSTSEPQDTISQRHITAFGEQHGQCLRGTRVDVLEDIRAWAVSLDPNSPQIYCIGDVAGTGKSTIAKTLAKEWYEKSRLVAMFFFSQEGSSLGTASDFCLSVADQIEEFDDNPELTAYWESISRRRKNLPARDIQEQWSKLVFQPLSKLRQDGHNRILVIDALDECTVVTRGPLLECLLTVCSSRSLPHIRVLVTTRMEEDLRRFLYRTTYGTIIRFRSLLNSAVTRSDIALYVTNRLDEKEILVSSPEERHQLISRCGGLFIFAQLACKLLEDAHNEKEPLVDILHRFTSLDALYHQALTRADKEPRYTRKALKDLLGVILVAQTPLPIVTIASLLSSPIQSVSALIESLGSVLSSGGVENPVYILHTTFIEFLLRQSRTTTSGQKITNEYAINRAQSNRIVAQRCLSVLSSDLKVNIGNYSPAFDLVAFRMAFRKTPFVVHYAAISWIFHIVPELHVLALRDATRQFFREKLLNWIEFGSISGNLSHFMIGIRRLHSGMQQIRTLSTETIVSE